MIGKELSSLDGLSFQQICKFLALTVVKNNRECVVAFDTRVMPIAIGPSVNYEDALSSLKYRLVYNR